MSISLSQRVRRPMTITSLVLIFGSFALLPMAMDLNDQPSLLPVGMLVTMIFLSMIAVAVDQRDAATDSAEPLMKSPKRVYAALLSVFIFSGAVHLVGFYPTTAIMVPAVAYVFGCKSPKTLAIASFIVTGLIYLIFSFAMSKEFPAGILWGV